MNILNVFNFLLNFNFFSNQLYRPYLESKKKSHLFKMLQIVLAHQLNVRKIGSCLVNLSSRQFIKVSEFHFIKF